MNLNPIGSMSPTISNGAVGAKENPQLKALEQKLSQLNKEKEKAEKAKDADKVRELEQKIQEIERQLEQLRNQKGKKEEASQKELPPAQLPKSDVGNYVDESV